MDFAVVFLLSLLVSFLFSFVLKRTKQKPSNLGGGAVILGLLGGVFLENNQAVFSSHLSYWFGLIPIFLMGLFDDIYPLRPVTKLIFQGLGVSLLLIHSNAETWSWMQHGLWIGVPLVCLWVIGITNSMNLLDNMDGLAGGVSIILALGLISFRLDLASVLVPMIGALTGFLFLNLPPARIYLGDSGSHLVGFTLAVFSTHSLPLENGWILLILFSVAICDTSFVICSRLSRGLSPFTGGKDHISHRLVRGDLSVNQTLVVLYVATILSVLVSSFLVSIIH